MRVQVCFIILSLTVAGCSSSQLVTSTGRDADLSFAELKQKTHNQEVEILLPDGTESKGLEFEVNQDSASWREVKRGGLHVSLPVHRIRSVSTPPNRLTGGLIGFGGGCFAGGILGWQVAQAMKPSGESGDKGRVLALGAGIGVVAGAVVGTIIGVIIVRPTVYEFAPSSPGN
jgi:hypothetical protein